MTKQTMTGQRRQRSNDQKKFLTINSQNQRKLTEVVAKEYHEFKDEEKSKAESPSEGTVKTIFNMQRTNSRSEQATRKFNSRGSARSKQRTLKIKKDDEFSGIHGK